MTATSSRNRDPSLGVCYYGPETITLQFPPETKFRLGGPELPVAGLTVVEHEN